MGGLYWGLHKGSPSLPLRMSTFPSWSLLGTGRTILLGYKMKMKQNFHSPSKRDAVLKLFLLLLREAIREKSYCINPMWLFPTLSGFLPVTLGWMKIFLRGLWVAWKSYRAPHWGDVSLIWIANKVIFHLAFPIYCSRTEAVSPVVFHIELFSQNNSLIFNLNKLRETPSGFNVPACT